MKVPADMVGSRVVVPTEATGIPNRLQGRDGTPKSSLGRTWDPNLFVGSGRGVPTRSQRRSGTPTSLLGTTWDSRVTFGNHLGSQILLDHHMGLPGRTWERRGTPACWLGPYWESHLAFGTPILRSGLPLLLWERGWIPAYLLGTIWDSRFVPNDTLGVPMCRWERHGTTMMALGIPVRSQSQIGTPISMLGPTGSPIPFPTEHWESQLFLGTPVGIPIRFRFYVWDPRVR